MGFFTYLSTCLTYFIYTKTTVPFFFQKEKIYLRCALLAYTISSNIINNICIGWMVNTSIIIESNNVQYSCYHLFKIGSNIPTKLSYIENALVMSIEHCTPLSSIVYSFLRGKSWFKSSLHIVINIDLFKKENFSYKRIYKTFIMFFFSWKKMENGAKYWKHIEVIKNETENTIKINN